MMQRKADLFHSAGLLALRVHSQVLLDVLNGDPVVVDVDARTEDVDPCKAPGLEVRSADTS